MSRVFLSHSSRDNREAVAVKNWLIDHQPSGVEPALLNLFCRELNEERKRRGLSRFDVQLVEDARRDTLSNYYSSCVGDLPPRVADFIESELITEKGFRDSYVREDAVPAHLTEDELARLIDSRLLRLEDRDGVQRIELAHDVLTGVVREHRDRRRADEEKAALVARVQRQTAVQREGELASLEREHAARTGAAEQLAKRQEPQRRGIFLCYRRDDSRSEAGRLADALANRFGDRAVFMDVHHLRIGNWREQIDQSLASCAAVIVVIGPQWLAALKHRSATSDQVRYEIAQALLLGKIIIPVAVDRARLPDRGDLPDDIAPLNDAQGYELGVDRMWRPTLGELLDDLSDLLRDGSATP